MNSSPFYIYKIDETHLEKLRDIAIRTFDETFSGTNSKENMESYFARCFNEVVLREELKDPRSWFYFIDSQEGTAGYLKVNIGEAQTEMQEEDGFEVERIYVLKKYYGNGVGAALMEHAINLGRESGKKYLWLGVHEENYRALRFYEKFGLKAFDDHIFMMGKQPQRDVLLKVSLQAI
ncbi:MAG: GNAT family N-acetyltransferase [Bacteroidales bacterium]